MSKALKRAALAAVLAVLSLAILKGVLAREPAGDSPRKVYVMLGFHSNFYHSWRGDTPDEAGFGTDIRLVRYLLETLDRANAEGLDARAYWDHDNLFTLGEILPEHAPDILGGIRRRVAAGLDEVALGAFSNGLTGAMTRDELRASVEWSISNPWGSGTRDVFGTYTPVYRPQEGMITTGSIPILEETGVEAVVLAYSEWPFNTFSNFVDPLPPEQRYGVTWLRLRDGGPRIRLLPAMSLGDVLNHVSLERWMLDLRELQVTGEVDRDLLLHMNFDADVESWIPQELPFGLRGVPNSGGLPEYVAAVNKYPWAEFITPADYLATHEPVGEVVVRQDLADGAFDGHTSWAEKLPSRATWTDLEHSRLAGRRARAWTAGLDDASGVAGEVDRILHDGRASSFFQRLRGLSTTHFGMSTPRLNEERQAAATRVAAGARRRAGEAERLAAEAAGRALLPDLDDPDLVARIAVRDVRSASRARDDAGWPATSLVRLPFLFAGPLSALRVVDGEGRDVPHAWLDLEELGDRLKAELWLLSELVAEETRTFDVRRVTPSELALSEEAHRAPEVLANRHLRVELAETGIASLEAGGWQAGGPGFLRSSVTYGRGDGNRRGDRRRFEARAFELQPLPGERPGQWPRSRLATEIPVATSGGEARVGLRIDLTLPGDVPWLVADVAVEYPYTEERDLLHTVQQKLRRFLDLSWGEIAPFEITPRLDGRGDPLKVWKHNFLDVTSSYPLDYGRINPRNAELDAFNHQVTAGWVAVSDATHGLLVADAADVRTSFAFAPMRLREVDGRQVVSLNPFGTYHGRQLAYDHLGGTGVGTALTIAGASHLRPNGPSYNGRRERFSLLIAPYRGDAPPGRLQADAEAFFHPPAVIVRTPEGVLLPADLRAAVDARRLTSGWTETLEMQVEPVEIVPATSAVDDIPAHLLARALWQGVVHWFTTP